MAWQVSSTITGGEARTAAELEEFNHFAVVLERAAQDLESAASAWRVGGMEIDHHRACLPWCPAARGTAEPGHEAILYPALTESASDTVASFEALAGRFRSTGDLLMRAQSLYSEADATASRVVTELIQLGTSVFPGQTAAAAAGVSVVAGIVGSVREGRVNPIHMITGTSWAQEGLMSGLGAIVGGKGREVPLLGFGATNELNMGAGTVAKLTSKAYDLFQGNALQVTRVEPNRPFLEAPRSIADAMANLERLGMERLGRGEGGTGLDYGTIAIQRFSHADGTVSWLVTIPGTDGKLDSPFGWPQNVELMSDDPEQRMAADSARMVAEAMRRAGIGEHEEVALIGHSQGGIVAATLAADLADRYRFSHVVTCGSPVANHPIPSSTWVTSVENDDELVSNLDGARNPSRPTWVTVRGTVRPGAANADRPFSSATVEGANGGKELSHGMNYLRAAYRNASGLGSSALQSHERHFSAVVDGTLEETTYWRGRMSRTAAVAPGERGDVSVHGRK
ncbi:hypothetical protein G1C96_0521 [Bifidobacterium sp. DSM 109958]|uniref:GPI inositol-deacylase PGAP1-like alpha/beta domain-containing protein n=1 Tax=Bifidobacterium moraviense TaxID=2675323 RepID=A0A7Y0F137_9BIFI|nr:alpha/beta hydrolase [Bifidobacterium sp. DSM 109958]NMM99943.1 hypothetical protein [Bifidobacterium sp. DSM 109958]